MTTHRGDVRADLGDYLEGDLPIAQRAIIDAHLAACGDCAARLAELRETVRTLRSLGDPEPPPGLARDVIARIEAGEGRAGLLALLLHPLSPRLRPRVAASALAIAASAAALLWVTSGRAPMRPDAPLASLQEALGEVRAFGASAAPDAASPAASSDPLDEALRDPAALLQATAAMEAADRDAWAGALAQQAGSRERLAALERALRGLADPRAVVLADALQRAMGDGAGR